MDWCFPCIGAVTTLGGRSRGVRRLIPDPAALQTHQVAAGDRLDLIAFRFYQDPEQYWRICDANRALLPEDLTREVGRRLRIPFAER